jgi:hypothetical protein
MNIALLFAAADLSDPVGIYGTVERVVVEPSEDAPERIQIWGVFSFAVKSGFEYSTPERGYLYFALPAPKKEVALKEWNDFKTLAGTGQVVGFASRYGPKGRLRKPADKPKDAEPHPLGMGLYKFTDHDYPYVKRLLAFPSPISPLDGAEVAPGKVTLVVRNILSKKKELVEYFFELESASGEKEASGAVGEGEKSTTWSPKTEIKAGAAYVWRVRAGAGPAISVEFKGK